MKLILAALLFLNLSACSGNSGNVYRPPSNTTPAQTFVIVPMCAKLNGCYPTFTTSSCLAGVQHVSGITAAMGLNATTYPALYDAEVGVQTGALVPITANINTCSTAIGALICTDPLVVAAYTTNDPTNGSNLYRLLSADTSCQHMTQP